MNFADRLKQLPSASHLAALHLLGADGQVLASIENKPGQTGSLVVYAALGALYGGRITPAAPCPDYFNSITSTTCLRPA